MEDILREMRADIKQMLINQARVEEKQAAHASEMHEHKIETDTKFQRVHTELKPLKKAYWGLAFVVGAIPVAISILKFLDR